MADGSKPKIKPVALSDFDAEIARRRNVKCADSFYEYCIATYPGLVQGWHLRELCWELQQFAEQVDCGESPRLIVQMPPRHTKSTTASQRFPVWCMAKWGWDVLLGSYGQDLADEQSLRAIEVADSDVTRAVFPHTIRSTDPNARKSSATERIRRWTLRGAPTGTTKDGKPIEGRLGTFACAGIDGAFTGRGAKVFICDDPHKNRADAESEAMRKKVKQFYTSTASTRLEPGGGILVIQTRWHDDDLAGWLQAEAKKPDGEKWRVVNFPAIAEVDEFSQRDNSPLRLAGEALHPARYPIERLRKIESIDPREFAALYQQRPVPLEGGLIKPAYLAHTYKPLAWGGYRPPDRVSMSSPMLNVPGVARGGFRVVCADTATKAGQLNDYTVIGSSVTIELLTYIADLLQRRLEFPALCSNMLSICERDDPHVVLIEDKGSGQSLIQQLPTLKNEKGELVWRWPIVAIEPVLDKHTRMSNETPMLEAGRVILPESAVWKPEFERELLLFPNAAHDDQVDYLSQLLWYLRTSGRGGGVNSLFDW